jgi:serine/threonine protein kinase/Tol biopolymer transport system component
LEHIVANRWNNSLTQLDHASWEQLAETIRKFEEIRQNGFVKLAKFLPPEDDPVREAVLVELIKVDQEFHWRQNHPKNIEDYLQDWPDLKNSPHIMFELLETECETRAIFDATPRREELIDRFPEIGGQINLAAIQAFAEKDCNPSRSAVSESLLNTPNNTIERTFPAVRSRRLLPVGQPFGPRSRYLIRECLDEGGMALVYRAYDTQLKIDVALKIPDFDPSTESIVLERLARESQAAAKIHHQNICPIFDAGHYEGVYYISMRLIEGESLAKRAKGRTISVPDALNIVSKIARALAAVHAEGIVHRDIKPSNVMIDRTGEPLLMDFGLAHVPQTGEELENSLTQSAEALEGDGAQSVVGSESTVRQTPRRGLTQAGALLGTLQYMSPEQTYGSPVDATSDIYSLGALLYRLLTGRLPFEGNSRQVIEGIRHAQPPKPSTFRPGLDAKLESICLKALAKNPDQRYRSAGEFADTLRSYSQPNSRGKKKPWIAVAIALSLFIGGLLAGIIIHILTDKGEVTIEVDPPDADVTISEENIRIKTPSDTITLYSGPYQVVGSKEGYKTKEQSFTVSRGRKDAFKLTLDRLLREKAPREIMRNMRSTDVMRWMKTPQRMTGIQLSQDDKTLYTCFSQFPAASCIQAWGFASKKLLETIDFPDASYDHKSMALSGDGRYLYVTNFFRRDISRIDLGNGNSRTDLPIGGVPEAVWAAHLGIAPDQSKLIVTLGEDGRSEDLNNDQVSIVDIADGRFALVGEVPLDDEPLEQIAFSADSRFVYVITHRRKSKTPILYEVSLQPTPRVSRKLSFPGGALQGVAVSDRRDCIYVSDSAKQKIWVVNRHDFRCESSMNVDGFNPGVLRVNNAMNMLGVLCPDSRKLFLFDCDDQTVVQRVDGLEEGAGGMEFSHDNRNLFVWHFQSKKGIAIVDLQNLRGGLVFASDRSGGGYQIYQMQNDGKRTLPLTDRGQNRCPRWSPDGRKIAFISSMSGSPKIYVTKPSALSPIEIGEADPAMPGTPNSQGVTLDWSADGNEIVFINGERKAICAVDVRTRKVRTLVNELTDDCNYHLGLSCRRKDDLILVNSQNSNTSHIQGIFLVDPKNGQVRRMKFDNQEPAFFMAPASSPDDKKLALLRCAGNDMLPDSIYFTEMENTHPSCLADSKSQIQAALRWSTDGQYLAYSASFNDAFHVFCVNFDGTKPVQVTSGESNDIEPDIYGKFPSCFIEEIPKP